MTQAWGVSKVMNTIASFIPWSSAAVEELLRFMWNTTVAVLNDTQNTDVELLATVEPFVKMGVEFV